MKRWLTGLALCVASLHPTAYAQAPAFPSKTIRIIVPFNAGSGSDTGARVYADVLSRELGQPVVVENRPGGSGLIAIQTVKQAPPDGHTIMLASNSPMSVNPVVIKDLPYDPFKEFRPIIGLGRGAVAFAVKGDSPYRSIQDVVDAAKREKRPLTIGNYSAGYQLVATWLGSATGTEVNHVAYKGATQMLTDVAGGALDIAATDFGGAAPILKDGRIRVLAITNHSRHKDFPNIPTMKELGFKDFETYVWTSFFVRSETPGDIVEKLAAAMQRVIVSEPAKAYHATTPSEVMGFGPDEMRKFQVAEYERFRRVAEAAGIKPQ